MRRVLFLVLGILILPAVASATNFVDPSLTADCISYETDFSVQFRPDLYTVNFDLIVTITNDLGEELFRYEMSEVLVRDDGALQAYHFSAFWNDVTDEIIPLFGLMDINAEMVLHYPESPYPDRVFFTDQFECAVVPNDETGWGSLKSTYR